VRALALNPEGKSICLYRDQGPNSERTAKDLSADATSYVEFERSFTRIGRVLAPLMTMTHHQSTTRRQPNCGTSESWVSRFAVWGNKMPYACYVGTDGRGGPGGGMV